MHFILLVATLFTFFFQTVFSAPVCGLVPPTGQDHDHHHSPSVVAHATNDTSSSEDVVATAWLPGWLTGFNLDSIPWNRYTHLTFSFAVTTDGPEMISLDKVDTNLLTQFVSRAQHEGVLAFVSIGGWTGSRHFSTAVQPANQDAFVNAVVKMANQYHLDGVDFDWEYPNHQGLGCNVISPDDSKNFLSFLQKLRADPQGSKLRTSAAVGLTPFAGPDGTPMTNVSAFSPVLDHIAVMAYDVWGSWSSSVGPNAPLDDSCSLQQEGSVTSAVKAWTSAGFPAKQIALGVAAYGHSFHVDKSSAVDAAGALLTSAAFDKTQQPPGEGETAGMTSTDECGATSGPSGVFNFEGLISAGFLQMSDNGTVTPASGMVSIYDSCSQTPYVYNPNSQVLVSYDNAESFAAKGKFINDHGLAGFAMWHAAGDSSHDTLITAISDAMGLEQYRRLAQVAQDALICIDIPTLFRYVCYYFAIALIVFTPNNVLLTLCEFHSIIMTSKPPRETSDSENDSDYRPPPPDAGHSVDEGSSDVSDNEQPESKRPRAESPKLSAEDEQARKQARDTLWASFQNSVNRPSSAAPKKLVKIQKRYRFAGEEVTEVVEVPEDSADVKRWPVWHPPEETQASVTGASEQPASPPPPAGASSTMPVPPSLPAKKPGPRKPKVKLAELPSTSSSKPKKLTTLDKSVMDWKSHVQSSENAGIQEELEANRRGGGYLEKVEFLQRVGERREEAFEAAKSGKRRRT
ncbi:hypothetical protein AX17_004089 [Amanita inopinata Kibby_2008]|nr:hypothetical protein AX17_004089 [Amanita inopinata Kibby_2008]